MKLTEQEIAKLKSAKSESEWNAICDEIKSARQGQYPPDWWPVVMLSGLAAEVVSSW